MYSINKLHIHSIYNIHCIYLYYEFIIYIYIYIYIYICDNNNNKFDWLINNLSYYSEPYYLAPVNLVVRTVARGNPTVTY